MKSGCHLNHASMAQTTPKVMRSSPMPRRRQPATDIPAGAGLLSAAIVPPVATCRGASPEPPLGLIELVATELATSEPLAQDFLCARSRRPSRSRAIDD